MSFLTSLLDYLKSKQEPPSAAKSGPNALGEYVAAEVTRAELDYQNVRSRALSLVAASGGLVALVSGLLAIAAGSSKSAVPSDSEWTIGIALGFFVISTICALEINLPQQVISGDVSKLGSLVECHWDDTGWDKSVATILVQYLASLRKDNSRNAKWLKASIGLQILGISFIAVSAILILVHTN